ncbi:MAG: CHAT domain-containing protein [Deltaproteobacteria bacterium]
MTILEAREADILEESDDDEFIFGGKTAVFETTLKMLMRLARKDPEGAYDNQALRIVEKLKAASFENSLFRTNVENFFDLPKELLIKEKSLKLGLRKLNNRIAAQLSSAKPDQRQIEKLIRERRAREKVFMKLKERLIKEYPAYAALRYPSSVSVHRLQKEIIRPDEAILEYMVTRSHTYVFAIDRQRFYTYSIDYSLKKLRRDVQSLVRPLYGAEAQESWDPSIAYRLYANIIKPVEHFIAGKKAVVIIPHGPLSSLPFEILVTSTAHSAKRFWSATDRPHYLVEKYAFCYAPSASMLSYLRERKRQRKPGWNLVAFGDAVYTSGGEKRELNPGAEKLLSAFNGLGTQTRNQNLRPLPGARKEIAEIAKIMGGPVQTYFGAEATETLFKKADLGRYGYIHLATHGLLLNGAAKLWRQPAIVFSLVGDKENDGFLQLGEVFGLKLNADLVVLSSCLSPGKPRPGNLSGLLGLSRAFLFAGADSVILSMWPVNDESTATLFINMYKKLQNVSKAEALRQAKLALLNNRATSHPYYWAPFVLVGKWNVTFRPGFNKIDPKKMRFKGLSTWRKFFSM